LIFTTDISPFLELHNTLPFANGQFYVFLFMLVGLGLLLKAGFSNSVKAYSYFLAGISFVYLLLLFPKPLHFIAFIGYGFFLFKFFSKKHNWKGAKIIILYVLPLFLMKLFNVLPSFKLSIQSIFQIAGLSYASFKMLQIHFDEANRKEISFISYFTFLAFPPTLLIGPIDRYERFEKNVDLGFSSINSANFLKGMDFLVTGLLFKYILATALNSLLLTHLDQFHGVIYYLVDMYGYLVYLFFDFAGYSLLAMAFGYFLGIQVPRNFDKPFLAQNPKEFWQRWHKSLGDWLNDYFFKPIFKNFTSKKRFNTSIQRQSVALFLTFTLMGFWNGFELHYVASGMLFGLYSVIHNYYNYRCKKEGRDVLFGNLNPQFVKVLSIFMLVNAVAVSIYIFSGKLF
jgi:membrane protein involved in D-alanine export